MSLTLPDFFCAADHALVRYMFQQHFVFNDYVNLFCVCRTLRNVLWRKAYKEGDEAVALLFHRCIKGDHPTNKHVKGSHLVYTLLLEKYLEWFYAKDTYRSLFGNVCWGTIEKGPPFKTKLVRPQGYRYFHPKLGFEVYRQPGMLHISGHIDEEDSDDDANVPMVRHGRNLIGDWWNYDFWVAGDFWRMWYKIIHRHERSINMDQMREDWNKTP